MVDHGEQAGIDLVALRQGLVEVHRAHHRAQIGGRERHERQVEVADLIGRLGGVHHLEEDDAVDRDHRIVLGDDLLAGDVDHLLHHVDLVTDAIEEGRDEVEAGLGDADEAAEMLDRIAIALVDDLHADHHVEQREDRNRDHERRQHLIPRMRHFSHIAVSGSRNERKIAVSFDLFEVRSILFLPASNPRAIAKARESEADLVVLDLEDAVKPADKAAAREAAVDAVTSDWPMPVAIRINGVGTEWHSLDLDAVARSKADLAVLPRAASAHLVREVREAIGKPLLAMIETAAGVLAAPAIAHEVAGADCRDQRSFGRPAAARRRRPCRRFRWRCRRSFFPRGLPGSRPSMACSTP